MNILLPLTLSNTSSFLTWSVQLISILLLLHVSAIFKGIFLLGQQHPPPQCAGSPSFKSFLDHKQRRATVGRTPLEEWSAHRRNLYLTKKIATDLPAPRGIRTAADGATNGTGNKMCKLSNCRHVLLGLNGFILLPAFWMELTL
jgi:hypothetical protein